MKHKLRRVAGILRIKTDQTMLKKTHLISISENNQIRYVYKVNQKSELIEVTCVSFEIRVQSQWHTILYYDNIHDGKLHRHIYPDYDSIIDDSDFIEYLDFKKVKSQKSQLEWAITEIKENYHISKREFIKKTKKSYPTLDIELY